MNIVRLLIVLTTINCALLMFQLFRSTGQVQASEVAPVLRARMLEIVDDQGRTRASIKLHPASVFQPTGKAYPETIMFRLIDANGRPEVKMGASAEGAGFSLLGNNDETQLLLEAEKSNTFIKLKDKDGKQHLIRP